MREGKEYCFYCSEVATEDKAVSDEVTSWIKKRDTEEILSMFKDKSLMNKDLGIASFQSYKPKTESQLVALRKAKEYVTTFDGKKGLFFVGRPGLGKSHLAASIVKELIQKKKTCLFISLPRLMTELKATYNRNSKTTETELLRALQSVDLLILDDLGVERGDSQEKATLWAQTKVFEIVDSRIGQATIYTTNFVGKELIKMYGERDFSRMVQHCEPITIEGENYRLKNF